MTFFVGIYREVTVVILQLLLVTINL